MLQSCIRFLLQYQYQIKSNIIHSKRKWTFSRWVLNPQDLWHASLYEWFHNSVKSFDDCCYCIDWAESPINHDMLVRVFKHWHVSIHQAVNFIKVFPQWEPYFGVLKIGEKLLMTTLYNENVNKGKMPPISRKNNYFSRNEGVLTLLLWLN